MDDDWNTPRGDSRTEVFFDLLFQENYRECHQMIDNSSVDLQAAFVTVALNVKPNEQNLALLRRLVNLMSDEELDDHDNGHMNYSVLGYLIDITNEYPDWRELIELTIDLIRSHDVNFYYFRRFAANPCAPVTQEELDIVEEIGEEMDIEDYVEDFLEMQTYAHICQNAEIRETMYRKNSQLRFSLNAKNELPQ